ncbi:DUF305 domain-containing protein [Brevundimonas phoenicis]|uniref:DUF305 domain-containing protein n=1 Tax=unclassified Brevundimonas TaxID=2622653 RepID=UPI0039A400AA
MHAHSYRNLAFELLIDFVIMYLVMFTMIATLDHFRFNLNNVYMTLMMVAPMAVVMLLSMRSMFQNRRANWIIIGIAAVVFAASFYAMRAQAAINDQELIRGMIPHHSGAILMCGKAKLTDPELIALCDEIIIAQEREIVQMQAILDQL